MKLTIDTDAQVISRDVDGLLTEIPLYSKQAFELLSDLWVKVGYKGCVPRS